MHQCINASFFIVNLFPKEYLEDQSGVAVPDTAPAHDVIRF
jgi:hypothetical protein